MATAAAMGSEEGEAGGRIDDESGEQHRLAADPVGQLPTGYWNRTPAAKNEAMTMPASASVPPRWRM